jgi:hypothetical protein
LAEAASEVARQHLGIDGLVVAANLPKFGKWDFIEQACNKAGKKALDKVPVAYEILELLDASPGRMIVDKRLQRSFKAFAEMLVAKVKDRPE